ncbi:hypothetical protein K7B09_13015, partial [Thermomonas sp. RSS23]
ARLNSGVRLMEKTRSPLIDLGILIAVLPAFLFTIGTAYRNGYLSALRLNAAILDQNFHQTTYQGFIQLMSHGFTALALAAVLLTILAYTVIPYLTDYLEKQPKLRKFIAIAFSPPSRNPTEHGARRISLAAITVMIGSVMYLYCLAHFENSGRNAGAAELKALLAAKYENSRNIKVVIDGKPVDLVYIACGSTNCAGYAPTSKRLVYFPQGVMSFPAPSI